MPEGKITPLTDLVLQATGTATLGNRDITIRGVSDPNVWFGPQQPLPPLAPDGTGGRQWDYRFGLNLDYNPRANEEITFHHLRNLAENLPILRIIIEKRKNQLLGWDWSVQYKHDPKDRRPRPGSQADPRVQAVTKIFRRPDRRNSFKTWLRMLLEDMLVIDAATIYPRKKRNGELYSLEAVDGSTIKPLIGVDGRLPLPEDGPAYQQILHGVPAADFALDELLYIPRNKRTYKLWGYSNVEQIVLTINIALQRDVYNFNYYREGTMPDSFGTLPKEWTPDQIRAFQDYFDSLLSGNLASRRKLKFMPEGFKLEPVKAPPMKDMYDDWLFKIICQAFSVPASSLSDQPNRATADTVQLTSNDEALEVDKGWTKDIFDNIIQDLMGYDDLEFKWSGDESLDLLQQAQARDFYIRNGTLSRDEVREEMGKEPYGMGPTADHAIFPLEHTYKALSDLISAPAASGIFGGVVPGSDGSSGKTPTPAAGSTTGRKQKGGKTSAGRTASRPSKSADTEDLIKYAISMSGDE